MTSERVNFACDDLNMYLHLCGFVVHTLVHCSGVIYLRNISDVENHFEVMAIYCLSPR